MSKLSLPIYEYAPSLLPSAEVAYQEIRRLTSLAQALNPDLPSHLRFFQRTGDLNEASTGEARPGRVVLTTDSRASLEDGLQDPKAVDLFDALRTVLPEGVVRVLEDRVMQAVGQPELGSAVTKAFAAAHAKAHGVSLENVSTNDPEVFIRSSQAMTPAPLEFRDDAFLSDVAANHLQRTRKPGEDPAFDFVANVNLARQALASDVGRLPISRIHDVIAAIRGLDGVKGEAPYEQRTHQGWIAYSALAGGKGWADVLLKLAPDVVSPHTGFRGVSAVAATVAAEDHKGLSALLDAGVSANAFLEAAPSIFGPNQSEIASRMGNYGSLLMLAAAVGNTEGALKLINHGAEVNLPNGAGQTPLALAFKSENEWLIRGLLQAHADPDVSDANGQTPRQMASPAMQAVLQSQEGVLRDTATPSKLKM